MNTHRKHRSHGFTLVELVLVMILTGILAATAIPRFFATDSFNNRGFYSDVINAIRYGQQYAVATNCPVQVSLSANGYSLATLAASPDCSGTAFVTPIPDPITGSPPFAVTNNDVNVAAVDGSANSITQFSFTALGGIQEAVGDITVTVGGIQFRIINSTGYILEL